MFVGVVNKLLSEFCGQPSVYTTMSHYPLLAETSRGISGRSLIGLICGCVHAQNPLPFNLLEHMSKSSSETMVREVVGCREVSVRARISHAKDGIWTQDLFEVFI